MKIAIIIRYLTRTGGAAREAMELCRELEKRGENGTVYTFAYDRENCFPGEFGDIKIVTFHWEYPKFATLYGRAHRAIARFFWIPLVGTTIDRFVQNQKAKRLAFLISKDTDVLNPHDQISVHTAKYFKKYIRKIPSVWMMNDLDIKRWSIFDHPLLHTPRRPLIKRIIDWMRDTYENKIFFSSQDKIGVIVARMGRLAKKYLGRSDAVVVRSGVDVGQFVYKERKGIQGKKIKLYCQGIFYVYRRFEDGIRAVKILHDWGYDPHLTITGDYGHKDTARAYHQTLVALCEELEVRDRVTFTGVISEKDLMRYYQESDIFIFASIQTWGIAIFEAMATGLPVILSKDAGAGEVLKDRKTMLLTRTGDPKDIAHKVKELIDNPMLYQKLAREGNTFVRNSLSWSKYTDNMLRLFEEALKETKKI
ncbi:MAG: Glycosyltransferase [Parcubacteria group bacterium Gr01-1014_33]|nr:MAG: Glycosyltransferase [Parcubacteria group bacterium Gr01-1014_33]